MTRNVTFVLPFKSKKSHFNDSTKLIEKKYIEGLITSARGEKDQICSVKETKCSVINVH